MALDFDRLESAVAEQAARDRRRGTAALRKQVTHGSIRSSAPARETARARTTQYTNHVHFFASQPYIRSLLPTNSSRSVDRYLLCTAPTMVKKPRKAASGSAARAPRHRHARQAPSPPHHEPPAFASDDEHSPPARSDDEQTEQKPRKSRKMKAVSLANLRPGEFGRPIHRPVPRLARSPAARAD